MAKEIERRAEEYVNKNFSRIGDDMSMDKGMKILYIEAATDQREKDIEKACEAYCKVCGHFPHTVPIHICRQDCRYYTDFKRAMEEE